MITITIPNNNIQERSYSIKIIFDTILGLKYEIVISEAVLDYMISFNKFTIIIKDSFWSSFPASLSYLNNNNLPILKYASNDFCPEKDIPVLYGDDTLLVKENQIICGIDIFASSFFMLTRWEEYVNTIRDKHNRFPGIESIAYKFGFINRPIVNEYAEMLWKMMSFFDVDILRRERKFQLVTTHDIDYLFQDNYFIKNTKGITSDILRHGDFSSAFTRFSKYFQDPFDTFSFLMDCSEQAGIKSHFYFMSVSPKIGNDYSYSSYLNTRKFKALITQINERGHVIGFHPGYSSYNNRIQWLNEKEKLESSIGKDVKEGRQHYLMMDMPRTLQIWNENKMEYDSSLGYADIEGFRCGTGDEYHYFDFLSQIQLNIKERPLIIMDGTLNGYRELKVNQVINVLHYYIQIGKKYNIPITILFHNSSFASNKWQGYKSIYHELVLTSSY